MSNLSDHITINGWRTTVFKMSSNHIKSCINLWTYGLIQSEYQRPNFIRHKINLYQKVLSKRYESNRRNG